MLLVLPGCGPSPDTPRLLRARFVDETPDGIASPGETILLVFDRPIELDGDSRSGLRLTDGASAGTYSITTGPDPRSLQVVLGVGDLSFVTDGIHSSSDSPRATGVSLDLGAVGGLTDPSRVPLRGTTAVVDLEPNPPGPALLEEARWVDRDGSKTVNQGDALVLRFSREVEPAAYLRTLDHVVPGDFLLHPNKGDRLDDGTVSTRIEPIGEPSRDTTLVLGSNPRLTIEGVFEPAGSRFAGSPSGIAVSGTRIRPHLALLDAHGVGVASTEVVDIDGACHAFQPHNASFRRAFELSGHTATPLPDGRIVITGGWRDPLEGSGNRREVTDEVWVYDPVHDEFDGPWHLGEARAWHTATYLPGPDGLEDTEDDFILILGGSTGLQAQKTPEILRTHLPSEPDMTPGRVSGYQLQSSWLDTLLTPRFEHTAHRIPETSTVVLVGGRTTDGNLTPQVEAIEVAEGPNGTTASRRIEIGQLHVPRIEHQSILQLSDNGWLLLVLGGYGGVSFGGRPVELAEGSCEVLVRPELFLLDLDGGRASHWPLENPGIDPRRGARIIPLREERAPWLFVGGTNTPPYRDDIPSEVCANAYRFELSFPAATQIGTQRVLPRLSFDFAGRLGDPRMNLEGTLLEDGRVLLVGGTIGREASAAAEIYDPDTATSGSFEPVCEELHTARGGFSRRTFTMTPTFVRQGLRGILILGGSEPRELNGPVQRDPIGCEIFVE